MACIRNCTGTPLCQALNLSCIQILPDSGKECDGLPIGYATIQINAEGQLVVCYNDGGVCECQTIVGSDDICEALVEAYDLSPWTALPLSAGWAAEAGQQAPEYRCLCTGEVQIRGCVSHDDADDDNAVPTALATIPATQGTNACRPGSSTRFVSGICNYIDIAPDGSITTNPDDLGPRCFNGASMYV